MTSSLLATRLVDDVVADLRRLPAVEVQRGPSLDSPWGDEWRGRVDVVVAIIHPSQQPRDELAWAEVACWSGWSSAERPRAWLVVRIDEDGDSLSHPDVLALWDRVDGVGIRCRTRWVPRRSRLTLKWEPGAFERLLEEITARNTEADGGLVEPIVG